MILQLHSWAYIWNNSNTKRHKHATIYSSTIYSSQDMEATQMSTNRQMDKEDVVCVHTHTHTHTNIAQP